MNTHKRFLLLAVVATLMITGAIGCGGKSTGTLRYRLQNYLYEKQPSTATEFIAFANKELTGYSSHQIIDALYEEGKHQAKIGHPSAVGVLSQFAAGYAATKGIPYDSDPWVALQKEALSKQSGKETPKSLWK